MPTFADTLRSLREQAGLTQQQLADKAGLHRVSLNRLEAGERADPPLSVVLRLCAALKVPLSRFRDVQPE